MTYCLRKGVLEPHLLYIYDKDNLITKAGDLSVKRDFANGLPMSNKIGNSENIFEYDSIYGELSKIEHRYKGISDLIHTFKRDALGRISEINSSEGAIALHYDESGRFLGRKYKGSEKIISQFNYDKNGNRVSGIDRGVTFEAEFDQQDRLVEFNDTTFTYNLNGTLATSTTDSVTTTYSFDVFGNLAYVSKTGLAVGYSYDGHNRRFEKYLNSTVVARYMWENQLRLAAVMNPDNSIKQQFVYADGVNAPEYMVYLGKRYHFVKDHRGSILLVVDSDSGEVAQKLTYSEFGEVLEDTNPGFQPFGFAGGLYDHDTKLVKFGARDYDGRIGRWLSKDPLRFNGGDTNLYGYSINEPMNKIDPSGLDYRICNRPLNGSGGVGFYPVEHQYISYSDGTTTSWGPKKGLSGEGSNNNSDAGGTCGALISASEEVEKNMKEWARNNAEREYGPTSYNCRDFVNDTINAGP